MPRLLHVSDTHLGHQAYSRLTADGLNQREVDAQSALARVVDSALGEPPDVFLHTGDLFDHPRPSNRAIAFALEQFRRLSEARIPTVVVSGNHDTPRMRETGHIFRVLEGLAHVRPVYGGVAERIEVGGLVVHAVPQAPTQEAFQTQLRSVRPEGAGPHVLAVHGTVLGVDGLFTSEFNEYQIPMGELRPDFDYIALGHFHTAKQVAPNAWYAGSTEYFSFNEAGQEKVALGVEVGPGTPRVTAHKTGARAMTDLGSVTAAHESPERILSVVAERVAAASPASVARLTVEGLERGVARGIDWEAVRAARPDLVHLDLRLRLREDVHAVDGELELHPLAQEFESFLSRYPLEDADRALVREHALRLLARQGGGPGAA